MIFSVVKVEYFDCFGVIDDSKRDFLDLEARANCKLKVGFKHNSMSKDCGMKRWYNTFTLCCVLKAQKLFSESGVCCEMCVAHVFCFEFSGL